MQIAWSHRANRDLTHIYDHISQDNAIAAVDMLDTILDAVENLSDYPQIGRTGRDVSTHELVVPNTPYICVYKIIGNVIDIVTILHGSRLWPEAFD